MGNDARSGGVQEVATGGALVAGAFLVLNVASYALTVVSARALGPAEYGQVSALMGILTIATVASLGLQTTAARRVAVRPEAAAPTERRLVAAAWRWAGGVTALLLAAAPVAHAVLDLDGWGGLLATAGAAGLITVMGGQAGVLQGERRWGALAVVYAAAGVSRLGFGAISLAVSSSASSVLTGVAVGAAVPVLLASAALRARRPTATTGPEAHGVPGLGREVGHGAHLLLAFFVLSNVDVLLARATLSPEGAGLFASGLIVSKAVLFLPQFVTVVAFPSMARDQTRRSERLALLVVLAVGLCAAAGVAAFSGLALAFAGGREYASGEQDLWIFALAGALLAAVQLLLYGALARNTGAQVWLVWVASLALIGVGAGIGTGPALLLAKVTTAAALLIALVALQRRGGR